jgi:hypothetical protein
MQHTTRTAPMTLRRCERRSCWRRFPVEVADPRTCCDDECRRAYLEELGVLAVPAPTPATPDAVQIVPAPRRSPLRP